jgi:hypothetical protein
VSCTLEVDVELAAGEYKSMDILVRQKDPNELTHFFEVKDVADLHEGSKVRPTLNNLFSVATRAAEPMDRVYLVHSAPSIDALHALRDGTKRESVITEARRHFHRDEKWKEQVQGLTKLQVAQKKTAFEKECDRHASTQLAAERDSIGKFSARLKLLHLPNCSDRLFKISDIELRIESAIREILAEIGRYDVTDYRAIRAAMFDYVKNAIVDTSQQLKADAKFAVSTIPRRGVALSIHRMFAAGGSIYQASGCKTADHIIEVKRDLAKTLAIPDVQLELTPRFNP